MTLVFTWIYGSAANPYMVRGENVPSHPQPELAMQLVFRYILAAACTAVICNSTILLAPAAATVGTFNGR